MTNDIDTALLQVYGLDQYGIDSAWRVSMGLDPLPSPEELAKQMEQEAAESSDSGSGETNDAAATEPESPETEADPSVVEEEATGGEEAVQPVSTEEPTSEPTEQDSGGSSSPCSAPPAGSASTGIGMLALMAAPLSLASLPFLHRRRK